MLLLLSLWRWVGKQMPWDFETAARALLVAAASPTVASWLLFQLSTAINCYQRLLCL